MKGMIAELIKITVNGRQLTADNYILGNEGDSGIETLSVSLPKSFMGIDFSSLNAYLLALYPDGRAEKCPLGAGIVGTDTICYTIGAPKAILKRAGYLSVAVSVEKPDGTIYWSSDVNREFRVKESIVSDSYIENSMPTVIQKIKNDIGKVETAINVTLPAQIQNITLGQITDGTINEAKMASDMKKNIAGGIAGYDLVNSGFSEAVKTAPGKKGVLYSGVLRNSGSGWSYIDDSIHERVNLNTVNITSNREIQINFGKANKVGSLLVAPDETLASFGITCGASVGTETALIKCYAPFVGYISGAGVIQNHSWFNNDYTVTAIGDGSGFNIDYKPSGFDTVDKVLTTTARAASTTITGIEVRGARTAPGRVQLRAYHDLYAYVYYDGSSWLVSSSCLANISASFSNGILTITHDSMESKTGTFEFQDINISMRSNSGNTLIHPRIESVNQSGVSVKFYDNSGNQITTPSTGMRLYFNRPGFKVPHQWLDNSKVFFDFGYALIKPENLISTSGNLWVLGFNQHD